MEVRLKVRWGSYLQGDVVSVSPERAKALVEAEYGKYVDPPVEEAPADDTSAEKAPAKGKFGRPK